MKAIDVLRRSGRSLSQAKARTFLTAAALAVGGFTLTITMAAANGARAYTDRLVQTNFDPSSLIVAKDTSLFSTRGGMGSAPQEYDSSLTSLGERGVLIKELNQQDVMVIKSMPGVKDVLLYYPTDAQFVTRNGAKQYTARTKTYSPRVTHQFSAGDVAGDLPAGSVVLPDIYVKLLGFGSSQAAVHQTITVQLRQITGMTTQRTFNIAAVSTTPTTLVDTGTDDLLLTGADAKAVYDFVNTGTINAGKFMTVSVQVKGGENKAKLNAVKQELEHAGYGVQSAESAQQFVGQVIKVLQIIILVFGLITLIASFFGVVNTQYISVLERTREIGLMKALGMRRGTVSWLFIVEAAWIGLLGALLGSIAALLAGTALNPWISKMVNFGNEKLLIFNPIQIAVLIGFLVLVTTIAGLLPARKAAKLDPIEALRTE